MIEKTSRKIGKTSGGVVLYVGQLSEMEMKEKKDRVDDASRNESRCRRRN